MTCEEFHPLLAGYVDGELSADERRAVDEHLARCAACGKLLAGQKAAAAAYGRYVVGEVSEAEWQGAWRKIAARLPAATERVSLESLAEIDVAGEFLSDEEPQVKEPERRAAPARPVVRPAPPIRLGEAERDEPLFKPLRIPRPRHVWWAHVAGLAASVLIVFLVWLSVKPVIHVDQLANVRNVELEFETADNQDTPVLMMLRSSDGAEIPLIWIAQAPLSDHDTGKEQPQ